MGGVNGELWKIMLGVIMLLYKEIVDLVIIEN